ncbi:four helix bundle protein [Psychroflexus sp. ALD_RP9]|uniref:four helix bundle protein n=1 Tax=Psychroflexus sp. ALD_RP9 TaxID=2777186 RepID=UPI001A8F4771|nr:four helix bundle protein [Psychroflexus sp. ALD_RP9]QSS97394.1 four helix bundle protein [Psychroflexus sp. ALD_RP9]
MHNDKELKIEKKSINFVENRLQLITNCPNSEKYALIGQIKRIATSVASKISERASRNIYKDYNRFLSISKKSLNKFNTQLIICYRLNFMDSKVLDWLKDKNNENIKMIYKLNQSLDLK